MVRHGHCERIISSWSPLVSNVKYQHDYAHRQQSRDNSAVQRRELLENPVPAGYQPK
jgi:hypothetical protein